MNQAPISVTGPPPAQQLSPPGQVQARFDGTLFDGQTFDKGNEARLEVTSPCPCAGPTAGSAVATCINCGGHGFVVTERRKIHALFSGMNAGRKQLAWSENLVGTSSITLDSHEYVTVGDRLLNLSAVSEYTELLKPPVPDLEHEGALLVYPTYAPLEVRTLLVFLTPRSPLRQLRIELGHYELVEATGAIRILAAAAVPGSVQLSIRYKHHPAYEIIDLPRDTVSTPAPGNMPRNDLGAQQRLPQHAVGRRLHFLNKAARPGQIPLLPSLAPQADALDYIAQSNPAE